MAQTVKCLPAMQETEVQSLGQEDPLEKEMTTHSSVLAWRIPGTGEPGGLPSLGSQSQIRLKRLSSSSSSSINYVGFPGGVVVKNPIHLPVQETQETWV